MGRTGEKCKQSGVYKCQTHSGYEIPLSEGETFPPCNSNGSHATTWILVRKA
jgi:hypothetical protein